MSNSNIHSFVTFSLRVLMSSGLSFFCFDFHVLFRIMLLEKWVNFYQNPLLFL